MFKKRKEETKEDLNDFSKIFASRAKKDKVKKLVKRIIIIGVILFFILFLKFGAKKQLVADDFPYEEVLVDVGTIDVSVEGDGTIYAKSIYSITPRVTGEILNDNVELNKQVEKGDILYTIDTKDINSTLNQAGLAVEQSNVSLEQSRINYNNVKKQINDLNIYATSSGYVDNLKIDKGSYVSSMSQICDVKEKNSYEVTLDFMTSSAREINIGDRANIFFIDFLSSVDGYVTSKADSTALSDGGTQVTKVTLKATADGYSVQNARVKATVYTSNGNVFNSASEGYFKTINSDVVVSNGTGVVKEVYVKNGSYVKTGDLIAVLENSSLDTQLDSAEIAVKNAEIAVKNAKNSSDATKTQLDNYYITAPISGKVIYKNAQKGDVISNYQLTNSNVMAVIADTSALRFDVQVDELDISKIEIGQEVIVKVEALDNKEFIGHVENINTIGISNGGITNYTVLIEIPGTDEIYSGMTVDAKIKIAERENVIRVPLTAVRKNDVVYRKVSDIEYQDADSNVPKGYEKVNVELGLNNNEYIEITKGLSKDDVVLVDKVKESGALNMENIRTMMMEN